ncbi:3-hydroxyisobutyrate dehydrogenase, partial [Atractiella rhizophila]
PADIARNCSVILTMLPSSPHVADLYLGPNGIVPTLKKLGREVAEQTLCIDHTSLDHTVAQEVAKQVRETGARMIDAPVSGGVNAAIEGKLSFMVGGEEERFAAPLLQMMPLMGKKIFHCGDSGSGMAAKICNNLLLGISMTGTAEAMLLGSKLGLKPEVLAAVINSSTGRCWASELNNPVPGALPLINPNPSDPSSKPRSTSPADRNYAPGFKTSLMAKDLGLAINAGGKEGLFLPLGSQVRGLYDVMASRNWGDRDFGVVYKFL